MMKKKNKIFSDCLVLAEIAQAHDGSLGMAHAFIDAVADAGADGIKFQTHYAREESTPDEPWRIKFSRQDKTRYEYWKRMEFLPEQWVDLRAHAHDRGLLFVSSPFSLKAVEVLHRAEVDIWKIASGEVNNLLMLEKIAETGTPVMISSGMSTVSEIDVVLKLFKSKKVPHLLFQCTSSYPVQPEKVGLNLIPDFQQKFKCPIGLSDHSAKIYTGLAAVALGAKALEVHVAFHRKMFGPDVVASLTLEELAQLAEGTRWIEKMMKNPVNKDSVAREEMREMRHLFMKSIVAKNYIPVGKVIYEEDIAFKKPLKGIPAQDVYAVLGKKATRELKQDVFIQRGDIES